MTRPPGSSTAWMPITGHGATGDHMPLTFASGGISVCVPAFAAMRRAVAKNADRAAETPSLGMAPLEVFLDRGVSNARGDLVDETCFLTAPRRRTNKKPDLFRDRAFSLLDWRGGDLL